MGMGRLAVLALAILVAGGGLGAAIGEALGDDSSTRTVDAIDLRKDDRGDEIVDDDPDGDGTRGGDATRGNDGTRGGNNTGDGDATWGNDGSAGGDNSYVAPAPAPNYGGGGGEYSDDGGGSDG